MAPLALLGAVAVLTSLGAFAPPLPFFWMAVVVAWLFAWLFVERLSKSLAPRLSDNAGLGLLVPVVFGAALLVIWEVVTRGANVPPVLLPAPSAIGAQLANSAPILWADFVQTFIKSGAAGLCHRVHCQASS
ncbi:MAG: hypothetical protein NVV63_12080 [Opitutus sp.]|nr:hypothetical protein [Opitutus sp.]